MSKFSLTSARDLHLWTVIPLIIYLDNKGTDFEVILKRCGLEL